MTEEQINSIAFMCVSHLATADYHVSTYKAVDVPFELYRCGSVPTEDYKMEHPRARTSVRYSLNGEVMSRKKLIDKLKEIEV
ncbi:MAG: hypothetical protein ACI3ZP_05590 [Candidatus Cryptobacteroides sp.]